MTDSTYTDIYVRDTFSDDGTLPSTGVPSASPDIIPYQSGVLAWQTASDTYPGPTDIGLPIIQNSVNNLYVRAKNLGAADTASVQAFYAKASLLLSPADTTNAWQPISAAGGSSLIALLNSANGTSIAEGGIALSESAFLLTGLPPVDNDHYCLIAVVQSARNPVTIPTSFATNADFVTWVQANAAVAWRNISYIDNGSTEVVYGYQFGNTNVAAKSFLFQLATQGFPAGTTVEVQCTDSTCPIDWTTTLPAPVDGSSTVTSSAYSIPGSFFGGLTISLTAPSKQSFASGATAQFSYSETISSDSTELERRLAVREGGNSFVVGCCNLVVGS